MTDTAVIEPMRRADAIRCAELESLLFARDNPWPARAFRDAVAFPGHRYVAARIDGLLVGYAGAARLGLTPPLEYEVHTIGVDPDYQGRGVGRRLLAELLEFACDGPTFLEVRTDNASAIALYESVGFVTVGVRKNYYPGSRADAFTMRREPQETP